MLPLKRSSADIALLPDLLWDRRADNRTITVFRVARAAVGGQEALVYIRNISDGGMKLGISMPVMLDDVVQVWISETICIEGKVVWYNGEECAIKLAEAIDSAAVLRLTAEQLRSGETRSPRFLTDLPAVITSERGMSAARVRDVSQRGMKIAHDGSFAPGLAVKIQLESGIERRGFVRWVRDELAGISLTELFSVDDVRTVRALNPGSESEQRNVR